MKTNIMENKNNGAGIGSGFLFGLLLGILLTLLVTTKKGREILREVVDKVMQRLSDIDRSLEKIKAEQKVDEENDYVKPAPMDIKKEIRYLAAELSEEEQESDSGKKETAPPTVRREKTSTAAKVSPDEPAEQVEANHSNRKNEKLSRRLFFRKAEKKS